jgi:glycerophosphoryl diester phosphodiesterase
VFVYTVNQPDDIARLEAMGVDGVFTDFPERVILPALRRQNHQDGTGKSNL